MADDVPAERFPDVRADIVAAHRTHCGEPLPTPAAPARELGTPGSLRRSLWVALAGSKWLAAKAEKQRRAELDSRIMRISAPLVDDRIAAANEPIIAEQEVLRERVGTLETIAETMRRQITGLFARLWNSRGAGRNDELCQKIAGLIVADVAAGRTAISELRAHPKRHLFNYGCKSPHTWWKAIDEAERRLSRIKRCP